MKILCDVSANYPAVPSPAPPSVCLTDHVPHSFSVIPISPYRLPYRPTSVHSTVYLPYYRHNHLPIILCLQHTPFRTLQPPTEVLPFMQIITVDLPIVIRVAHFTSLYRGCEPTPIACSNY